MKNKNNYQKILFPILNRVDPETTHNFTISILSLAQRVSPGRKILSSIAGKIPYKPIELFGLSFPNVLGVAAGFDKEGGVAAGLAHLGFGHIEIGTITPRAQIGNPRPRIFRLPQDDALINRMGFPSSGVEKAVHRLNSNARGDYVLGISIGKQKETPLANAIEDYITVLRAVFPYADYLAINISSPNTPELRQLQGSKYLGDLISALMSENMTLANARGIKRRPLLIKIAPDITLAELDELLQIIIEHQVDGVIATNTTTSREGLRDNKRCESGGLSGAPLAARSTFIINHIGIETNHQLPIIGVGGIRSAADIQAKLDAGASLVQLYTAIVYEGPGLAGRILRSLK